MDHLDPKDPKPKKPSIPNQTKPVNMLNMLNMLNQRTVRSVYASKSLMDEFSMYAKGTRESVAYHLEQALIEYMLNHPRENRAVIIQHMLKKSINNGLQRELEEQLLCSNIKAYLDTIKRIEQDGRGDIEQIKVDLCKSVSEAVKFREPTDKLLNLLQQVKDSGYLE